MRITRPSKTRRKHWMAKNIQAELLRLLRLRIKAAKKQDDDVEEWEEIYSEIAAISEGFKVSLRSIPYAQVDRRCSMLAGPFFVTPELPAPVGESGIVMYPVVQFDLAVLSKALGDDIGTGLLQLWFDVKADKELIRVIPQAVLDSTEPTDFLVHPLDPDDSFPLADWLERDPVKNGVKIARGLVSYGYECTSDLSELVYFLDSENAKDEWLSTLLAALSDVGDTDPASHGSVDAGGTLRVIQYNQSDIQMRRLLQLSDWGSSGSAEIFFRTHKGEATEFSFWSCVR